MTRWIFRYANFPALVILVAIGCALQTSLFSSYPLNYLQPDVVLLAVIWCALKRSFLEGGVLTLILADIAEVHSAAPKGLFLIAYMGIYLAMRGFSKIFVIPSHASMVTITLFASLACRLEVLAVLRLLGSGSPHWRYTIALTFFGAASNGVLAIWAYRWLEKFDWVTYKNVRARQALEDELQMVGEGL